MKREPTEVEQLIIDLAHDLKRGTTVEELRGRLISEGTPEEQAEGLIGLAERLVV